MLKKKTVYIALVREGSLGKESRQTDRETDRYKVYARTQGFEGQFAK